MHRPILDIYAALVCFVSIACLALATGIILYNAVSITIPSLTLHPMAVPPGETRDFLRERPMPFDGSRLPADAQTQSRQPLSEEEMAKRRLAEEAYALQAERRVALQSLIRWSIAGAIALVLFVAHWRILRRAQGNPA